MKKLLPVLLFVMLFVSCSKDNDGGEEIEKPIVDESIQGYWKVEYSKTIDPAKYNEETGKVDYNEDADIREYLGNWGEIGATPQSGMFDIKELRIRIGSGIIVVDRAQSTGPKTVDYAIVKKGSMEYKLSSQAPLVTNKYFFIKDTLVMEIVKINHPQSIYVISKYTKIKE